MSGRYFRPRTSPQPPQGWARGRAYARPVHRLLTGFVAAILLAGCGLTAPMPVLMRDSAGLFTPPARQAAEDRLRSLSAEHDILFFIVTDHGGDPPRMLRVPAGDAERFGWPFVAFLLSGDMMVGGGMSDTDRFGSMPSPEVDGLLAEGRADEALELLIDAFVEWSRDELPAP